MIFSTNYKQKNIGKIELNIDSFSVDGITDKKQKKILGALLDIFYKNGVPGVANAENPKINVIKIEDNVNTFVLETGLKLKEFGYTLE